MTPDMHRNHAIACLTAVLITAPAGVHAWDYDGHRVVNQLALTALPADFPAFVRAPATRERIAFLSGEPDRWRNAPDELSFSHATGPDHYFDLEYLEAVKVSPEALPIFRYEFAVQLAAARTARPGEFPPVEATRNRDHTRELIGFLPWRLTEDVGRLKSAFACLNVFERHGGTAEEIANTRANVVYAMGVMGHFVADAAQPLHTTKHHHGWVGENPKGYTTNRGIHQWIDGGYFAKAGGVSFEKLKGRVRPARLLPGAANAETLFRHMTACLMEAHAQVEPLYQLEKDGRFSGVGDTGLEGRVFLEGQLVRAGQMLGDVWFTAWQLAPDDKYLQNKLAERRTPGTTTP